MNLHIGGLGVYFNYFRTIAVLLVSFSFNFLAFAQQSTITDFFSLYSRPNDDRFQNAAGASGEPYEVSRIRVNLNTATAAAGIRLKFQWSAIMTTGRQVEAANHFLLMETASNLPGSRPGRTVPLRITYPKGSTVESSVEKKVGSVLDAELDLGVIERDGTYRGELQIRNRGVGNDEKNRSGVTQLLGRTPSTFQTATWTLRISEGRVVEASVQCQRFAEPLMRLISSNWRDVDTSKREHQSYPKQPKAAPCKTEVVGKVGEELEIHQNEIEQLTVKLAPLISEAGCLDCHAEGNENNFRFCDSGKPIYPEDDAHSIFSMISNASDVDWDRYPTGMRRAIENLSSLNKDAGIVSTWAFKHGVSPGLDFVFNDGIQCEYDIRFRDLSGKVIHESEMSFLPIEKTISRALASSCDSCLRELQKQKRKLIEENENTAFLTYACVLPRTACRSLQDGATYSANQKGLHRALSGLRNPEAPVLCRIE